MSGTSELFALTPIPPPKTQFKKNKIQNLHGMSTVQVESEHWTINSLSTPNTT
jgi:hypothetical protein